MKKKYEVLVVLFIFIVHSWGFWDYSGITVLRDEFGYWEHAASLRGYDWSGAMLSAPWYGFGYSLLLTPLLYIFSNMSDMYHVAILLNGAMMVGVYAIVKSIMRHLYPQQTERLYCFSTLIVCLYSPYIAQSKVAWAEITIYLSFWMILWCFINFFEQNSLKWSIAVSVFTGVTYICHNRMIVVIIALLIMAVIMKLSGRITWKNMLGFIVPVILIYIGNEFVKAFLQSRLQMNADLEFGLNDINGRLWRLKAFFSIEGIGHAIRAAMGELVYVNLASFTIGIIGIWAAIRRMVQKSKYRYFIAFILLVFIGEWGISTLVNMPFDSDIAQKPLTYLYYGRYVDGIIGIFILIGLGYIWTNVRKSLFWELLLINVLSIIGTVGVYIYSQNFLQEEMNFVCVPGIWYIGKYEWLNIIVATLAITMLMQILTAIYLIGNYNVKYTYIFGTILASLCMLVGITYTIFCIGYVRSYKKDVFVWVEENARGHKVYCFIDENTRFFAQAQLMESKVQLISKEDVQKLEEDSFLITMREEYAEVLNTCINSEMYYVLITNGEVYEELIESKEIIE